MENLKVVPGTVAEGPAMEAMFDGFRKAARHGNDVVIVYVWESADTRPISYMFKRTPLRTDVYSCTLHDDEGSIVAACRMDQFDL